MIKLLFFVDIILLALLGIALARAAKRGEEAARKARPVSRGDWMRNSATPEDD